MIKVDIAKAYFEDEEGKLDLDSSLIASDANVYVQVLKVGDR